MAAPSTAYLNKNINTISATGQQVTNSRAIPTDSTEILKARFYLDNLMITKDSDGNEGFTGLVGFNGSNYKYHNPNRMGSIRSFNGVYQCNYTDAGLNTKGHTQINSVPFQWANRPKVNTLFKASYYSQTNIDGLEYKINGGQWIDHQLNYFISNNNQITTLEVVSMEGQKGNLITIRPYIDNEEGRFYGNEVQYTADDRIETMDAYHRTEACGENGDVVAFWLKGEQINLLNTLTDQSSTTGIYPFLDEDFTIPLPNGYYMGFLENPVECLSGQFTRYVYCAPPITQKDIYIYLEPVYDEFLDEMDWYFNVSLNLSKTFPYSVTVSGNIGAFDGADNGIGGARGNGNWTITIPSGQLGGSYQTSYQRPFNSNVYAHSKAISISTNPTGMTWESFAG